MSLIEAALQKAKSLTDSGRYRAVTPKSVEPAPVARPPVALPQREQMAGSHDAAAAVRVEQARALPVGRVDAATMELNGVLLEVDDVAAKRSYRILRTRVQQRMQAQDWHSIAITSCGPAEGKTTTAVNLALALARDVNTWVRLVDLDLMRPRLGPCLGLQFEKGVGDYLTGAARFDEIVYGIGVDRLGIVPCAEVMENSSDLLGSPRMRELCRSLAAEEPRPIVIFDLPPLLMGDDVLKFRPNVDCTLLVVSEGQTSRSSIQQVQELLQEMNLLGVLLNRSAERVAGGYYY